MALGSHTRAASGTAASGHDLVSHRPGTLERSFPATIDAPGAARRALEVFAHTLDARLLDDLRLLVSELVANAVQHGLPSDSSCVTVRVLIFPATVAAVVEDDGPGFKEPPAVPTDDALRGWGLYLVPELAARHGIESSPRTAVWFELDRREAAA